MSKSLRMLVAGGQTPQSHWADVTIAFIGTGSGRFSIDAVLRRSRA